MKLLRLHKRIAAQAMNPNDPHAEAKAKAMGWNENGSFISLHDKIMATRRPVTIEHRDKDGRLKQKIEK